jgi:hypothetical protein
MISSNKKMPFRRMALRTFMDISMRCGVAEAVHIDNQKMILFNALVQRQSKLIIIPPYLPKGLSCFKAERKPDADAHPSFNTFVFTARACTAGFVHATGDLPSVPHSCYSPSR